MKEMTASCIVLTLIIIAIFLMVVLGKEQQARLDGRAICITDEVEPK